MIDEGYGVSDIPATVRNLRAVGDDPEGEMLLLVQDFTQRAKSFRDEALSHRTQAAEADALAEKCERAVKAYLRAAASVKAAAQ